MKRLLLALPLALLAGSVLAQEIAPDTYKDLWCATAYKQTTPVELMPPEDRPRAQIFLDAADKLLERGVAGMASAGFAADTIDKFKQNLLVRVAMQVQQDGDAEFQPAECDALMRELLPPEFLADQSEAQ